MSEKTIDQINDAKKKDPRDTAILQVQTVQLKVSETKHCKKKHVLENKIQGQLEISQHEELFVLNTRKS